MAFNKPVGIVCTTDTRVEKDNIIDFINYPKRIFPIGRLDKPSEGLIFLTSDGEYIFNYNDDYVINYPNQFITFTLPVTTRPYKENWLFPFFEGLIPEGWLLDIASTIKKST